jgi:ribonuclease P protein component
LSARASGPGGPTISRLTKRAEFLAARRGRRLNGPFFLIEALDRADGGSARYGLTVTRKVGNAVERNRIRRRLREAIRTVCGADMAAGFDYVIVARRELLTLPFETLTGELSRRVAKVATGTAPKASRQPPAMPPSGI